MIGKEFFMMKNEMPKAIDDKLPLFPGTSIPVGTGVIITRVLYSRLILAAAG